MVVRFDVETAEPDGQQPRAGRVGPEFGVDVGRVDDAGQPGQGGVVAELVVVDKHLEGASSIAVVVSGAGGVEAVGALGVGHSQDIGGGDVEDLGVGVDETPDQPGAGDPVGLGAGAG